MALVYVGYQVPLRLCFSDYPDPFGTMWWFDLALDVYFFVDVLINFRSAFYLKSGLLEAAPREIARHYIRTWFLIDFVSCLPVQYVVLVMNSTATAGSGSSFRAGKSLRLLRIAKLLRLARIKKILQHYEDAQALQPMIGVLTSLFSVLFAAHILAWCVLLPLLSFPTKHRNQEHLLLCGHVVLSS